MEIRRVLRPGGCLIVEVSGKYTLQELINYVYGGLVLGKENKHLGHCNFFTYERLKQNLGDSGFVVRDHKLWGGPLRGTLNALLSLGLSIIIKVLLHQRRCDLEDNQRIRAVHRRLSPIYSALSRIDQFITRKILAFVEVIGFVCEAV